MCFGATCPTCSKKTWRGCGSHIPQAMSGVAEDQWCTCEPKVEIGGKQYPPAAKAAGWFGGLFGGGSKKPDDSAAAKKDDL